MHRRATPTPHPILGLGLLLACALAVVWGFAPRSAAAQQAPLSSEEIQQLSAATLDPQKALTAIPRLRSILASNPEPNYAMFARQLLLRALMVSQAPVAQIIACADTASANLPDDPQARIYFYGELSQYVMYRGGAAKKALEYARHAVESLPKDADPQLVAIAQGTLGRAQLENKDYAGAIATLTRVAATSPDSQRVLSQLGTAYEAVGKADQAIDAYIRSVAVFAGRDSSAAAPLQALYVKRHGSAKGLDARIAAARGASRNGEVFVARRHEQPAPAWSLPTLAGKTVKSADLAGKVVVLDFWGSWCGPCRMELPLFQALYQRYKDRGVAFYGVNWERPGPAEARVKLAKDYMEQNKLSFPVVLDHEQAASTAFGIQAFPTVYLIDKTGKIRFRNVGFSPEIDEILTLQLDSLLK